MDQSIKAGIIGLVLAVMVNVFSPVYLDWIPAFVVAIFAIYAYRLSTLKDGLVAAFMTYIFSNGILGTLTLATFYAQNKQYPAFTVDPYTMLSPLLTAITAVIAAYVGVWLAKRRTPLPQRTQSQSTDIPPDLQTV
jgi:cytochrome c biogenesis protein CcdA